MATGNTERTRPENRLYFPALDGIRAVALLMVFGQHYFSMPWGYTGVDAFFVLSGFLITGILFDTRMREDRVGSFFVRRTLRIFPLYYGVFLVLLLLTPIAHFRWSALWWLWPTYLGNFIAYLHPYSHDAVFERAAYGRLIAGAGQGTIFLGHFWSLCVEEQFYLLWPWVVFFSRGRRQLLWICAASVVLLPLVRVVVMARLPIEFVGLALPYRFTPLRFDSFLLGGMLALLIRGDARERTLRAARWFVAFCAPLVAGFLFFSIRSGQAQVFHVWRWTWGQSLVDLIYVGIIAVALVPGTVVFRICSLRLLRWLGRISYGLYVFHDLPHRYYTDLAGEIGRRSPLLAGHPGIVTASIALPCTVLVSWLSFRFFETPFLDLKERWAPSHS